MFQLLSPTLNYSIPKDTHSLSQLSIFILVLNVPTKDYEETVTSIGMQYLIIPIILLEFDIAVVYYLFPSFL